MKQLFNLKQKWDFFFFSQLLNMSIITIKLLLLILIVLYY